MNYFNFLTNELNIKENASLMVKEANRYLKKIRLEFRLVLFWKDF